MTDADFAPICTVLAGPNGSGKSSAARNWLNVPGEIVNADVIARLINPEQPEAASRAAGRAVLKRLDELVEQRQNFNFETTLSSQQALQLIGKAKSAGFKVVLIFVTLESVDMNVLRVRQRVAQGGHSIPEHVIRRRYDKTFENLPQAISLADESSIVDNSKDHPEALAKIVGDHIVLNDLDEAQPLHVRVANALSDALNMPVDAVFRAAKYE
jgi:predicted ABC-type ATPase